MVTDVQEVRRNNFEITCYGEHISLCFWSGSRENTVVVELVDEEIRITTTAQSSPESQWASILQLEKVKSLSGIISSFLKKDGRPKAAL